MYKVLQVFTSLDRGGAETFIMNVYRNIDREKISFDFIVHTEKYCDYDDEIISMGGNIYRLIPRNQGIIKHKNSWKEFFKKHSDYNAIHFHKTSFSDSSPIKIAYMSGIKKIITHSHNTSVEGTAHQILHTINKRFVSKYITDYCACSNEAAYWLYGEKLGRKAHIINNGINAKKFRYDHEIRKHIRKEENLENKFVIGHVGRFTSVKNHYFLIDIFKKIREQKQNALLLLVGQGELLPKIKIKVKESNLEDSVIFAGVRTDIDKLMQGMDIFLLPSLYEGLPVTLVEAQAAGLKCFVSENVSKKAAITPLIKYLPTDKGPDCWARIICEEPFYEHCDSYNQICDAKYDIESVVNKFESIYLE